MFGIGGDHAADWESVPVVPVGHGPRLPNDAGHGGCVDQLLGPTIVRVPLHVGSIRDEASVCFHCSVSADSHRSVVFGDEVLAPAGVHVKTAPTV